jgi:flagellar biosynthetic protein FliR
MDKQQVIGTIASRFHIDADPYYVIALFLLIFARTMMMVTLSPIFGGKTVLQQVKVGIAAILSVAFFPLLYPVMQGKIPVQGMAFWGLLGKEMAIGALIGFATAWTFTAFESSGHLLDVQRGTAQASVLVPQLDIQGPIFANLQAQLGIVLFFTLNLHHLFLNGYYQSFDLIPVNQYPNVSNDFYVLSTQLMVMTGKVFIICFQVSAPVLIALFMVDVVLGVMNRLAPAVNVTFLGQPVKAAVGIIMFLFAFSYMLRFMAKLFIQMIGDVKLVIKILS